MPWIDHPVALQNEWIKLRPLERVHFDALTQIAKNKEIWQHLPVDGTQKAYITHELKSAVLKRVTGEQYPFVIIDVRNDRIIGSTRLYNIYPEHKKLEIGWTWYDPAYWGTGYNNACKLLLLTYCFEQLKTVRVQLQTSEHNLRSRAAIQKIGATFEGILRNERIRPDGTLRNTAVFSIISDEWEEKKRMLEALVEKTIKP